MTIQEKLRPGSADARLSGIIKLAILAVGGLGGGVLPGWIVDPAGARGYEAPATSVAGVAQRTGATIYYIEMAPQSGGTPVFSLAPSGGDVDILIAAEMMEAGRAILRGFVTPDRTTLIASTHRALAVSEKMVPGDGIANADEVRAAAEVAAQRLILADFEAVAVQAGSVISASLFGALAGSGALPFPREAFEAAIRAGGKGVEASLRAFAAGYDAAQGKAAPAAPTPRLTSAPAVRGPEALVRDWQALVARLDALPAPVRDLAGPGLRKVVDFQDCAYGAEYLDRVARVLTRDDPARDLLLTAEAAKYIANAMAYDDVIRVADIKTRTARAARVRRELGVDEAAVLHVTEFMHPRAQEIVGLFPAGLGARIEASPRWMALMDRMVNRGRRLRTDSIPGFLQLWLIGGLRGWRRRTLRHRIEVAHLDRWLDRALAYRAANYDLAVETVRCRRLIKGYSDTHARGLSKFDRVMDGIALVADRPDAADWARRLRDAALQDEEGRALDGAIATIRSFA
ncbi:MAG: indolepyruvate oxidoreductase subunit beta family protein [Gemmobacter sp.]